VGGSDGDGIALPLMLVDCDDVERPNNAGRGGGAVGDGAGGGDVAPASVFNELDEPVVVNVGGFTGRTGGAGAAGRGGAFGGLVVDAAGDVASLGLVTVTGPLVEPGNARAGVLARVTGDNNVAIVGGASVVAEGDNGVELFTEVAVLLPPGLAGGGFFAAANRAAN
jgi:hypothetical protein